jgi:hypothetical protein
MIVVQKDNSVILLKKFVLLDVVLMLIVQANKPAKIMSVFKLVKLVANVPLVSCVAIKASVKNLL